MPLLRAAWRSPEVGLVLVILLLGGGVEAWAQVRWYVRHDGLSESLFLLRPDVLMEMATQTSFFAIMAAGATLVIISGGIDLSVGAIYALASVGLALVLRPTDAGEAGPVTAVLLGLALSLGIGFLCGIVNGLMIVGLKVHPFVITLGMMWIVRGIAFVISGAQSIPVPTGLMDTAKATLGLPLGLHPVPLLVMLAVTVVGWLYLEKTVMGRHILAVGGNAEASRFAGLRLGPILVSVYTLAGLAAGLAAFLGVSYYGSASCADATGYELYVIAAAVVGGTSLSGGKGSVVCSTLGAVLIALIRQAIVTLGFDQKYEWIIVGSAIIVAVVLDRFNARWVARRLAAEAAAARDAETLK